MQERYKWLPVLNRKALTALKQNVNSYSNSPDFERDVSAFLEYYVISYGLKPNELEILRREYLAPQLAVLNFVPKNSRLRFLSELEQHIRTQLNQEIFIRKLFAFVFQNIRYKYFSSMSNNDYTAFTDFALNFLNSGQILKKHLRSLNETESKQTKQDLLNDVQDGEFGADSISKEAVNFLAFVRSPSTLNGFIVGMMLAIFTLTTLNHIPPILALPLLVSLYIIRSSLTYVEEQTVSYPDNLKESFNAIAINGADKFQFAIKGVILSFTQDIMVRDVDYRLSAINDKQSQEEARTALIPTFVNDNPHQLVSATHERTTPIHESSQTIAPKVPKLKKSETFFPNTMREDKSAQDPIVTWITNTGTIPYNPRVYTEQIVELWSLNRGLMYLNNTFFVYWDPLEIKQSIQAIRNKDFEAIYDEFSAIGQTGHIVSHEGKSGYVDCTGQNDDCRFKIKSTKTYGAFRMYFKPISVSQSGKILLGEPQMRMDH